jgi:hypothetical protein
VAATPPGALKALSGPRADIPTAASRPCRLACHAPTAPPPTAAPRAPPTATVRSQPRVSERADAVVYPVLRAGDYSAPPRLAPPGHANPLHRHPRRSLPNRRAARRRRPRLAVPPNAVHASVSPRRAFPGRLPCAGEVTAAAQACRATARACHAAVPSCALAPVSRARSRRPRWARLWAARAALAEAKPGQAGPHVRCAGRLRRHCATGPREDSAQWHLIIVLYFPNTFNSL